jgi:hypothetical protein
MILLIYIIGYLACLVLLNINQLRFSDIKIKDLLQFLLISLTSWAGVIIVFIVIIQDNIDTIIIKRKNHY